MIRIHIICNNVMYLYSEKRVVETTTKNLRVEVLE
jgi:hypothetical protein